MAASIDPEVLEGFIREAQDYLPAIRQGVETLLAPQPDVNQLEEAYRNSHSMRGASNMIGLPDLANLAEKLELIFEVGAIDPTGLPAESLELAPEAIDLIETYLACCSEGAMQSIEPLQELAAQFPHLQHPAPESYDSQIDQLFEIPLPDQDRPQRSSSYSFLDFPVEMRVSPPLPPEAPIVVDEIDSTSIPSDSVPAFDSAVANVDLSLPDDLSAELLEVFQLEAEEHLRVLHDKLPELRDRPTDREALQQIRRTTHTLKGSAGMVGFKALQNLAHRMEDLLDELYEEGRPVTPDIIKLIFAAVDEFDTLAVGKIDAPAVKKLYVRFEEILATSKSIVPTSNVVAATAPAPKAELPLAEIFVKPKSADALPSSPGIRSDDPTTSTSASGQYLRVPIERLDDLVKLIGELVISRSEFEQRLGMMNKQLEELQLSTSRMQRLATQLETGYEAKALGGNRFNALPDRLGIPHVGADEPRRFDLLNSQTHGFDDLEFDRYTEFHLLTRELSETTSDLQSTVHDLTNLAGDFDGYLTRQSRLSSEVQDKLMHARMVPLATLATRLHRTVRHVAEVRHKEVRLELGGQNTELDKNVLESMSEPLLHLLRNAVDHGIESPDDRRAAGKPIEGKIWVDAAPEGTHIVIRIRDDGRGIDPAKIRASALGKALISSTEADTMSDSDAIQLLFRPGFSTASEISEISGRGVGLDVVKAEVHRLEGTVTIDSVIGVGTTFTVRLPLTLALMRALLVEVSGQRFALPLGCVRQLLRLEPEAAEMIGSDPVLRVGGKLYPRISLAQSLHLKQSGEDAVERPAVIVMDSGTQQIALIVDRLLGGREIVVKNLGTHLRKVHGIAGSTLLGDGSVVLIINPIELIAAPMRSRVYRPSSPSTNVNRVRSEQDARIMIVDDSPSVRRIIGALVKNAGMTPILARDGVEALEILNASDHPPALVLTDVEMPRMDGYDLLATIRALPELVDLPVIMVTSRGADKHRNKAMQMGATGYLVKPVPDHILLQTIRSVVDMAVGV
jgi:chemosensory pili system protein ChpA (sensor histidine kinase/response regulator)